MHCHTVQPDTLGNIGTPQCSTLDSTTQQQLKQTLGPKTEYKKELNALDHVLTEAKRGAENHCQKFKNGQVQWCPQVSTAINKILFLKSILKQETGSKVGLSILRTQAQKAKIDTIPYYQGDYQLETLQEIISKAYKQFNRLKLDESRCDTWMAQLILVQATAWNKKNKALWQQMQRTEKIRRTANAV